MEDEAGVKQPKPATVVYDLNKKRPDYIEWPEYFMAIAFLSAQRSKDPGSQVGACIVNREKKIVGIGYNGMPNGCNDDELPWRRTAENRLDTKYPYVCHAEMNAIMNKNSADLKDCIIYVALFPCNECAKLVIQSGIREIVYVSDKYHDKPEMIASRRLLDLSGVTYRKFEPKRKRLVIDFDIIDSVPVDNRLPPGTLSVIGKLPEEIESKELPSSLDLDKNEVVSVDGLLNDKTKVQEKVNGHRASKRSAQDAGLAEPLEGTIKG